MRDDDFARLYAAEAPGLFSFLAYRTGDRALAEDLLADTFERVLRKRSGRPRDERARKAWIYTIALNRLRDHLRRSAAEVRAYARAEPGGRSEGARDPGLSAVEHRLAVSEALEVLSPAEREAIALRFGAELTLPEMAAVLGEPLTTVEGRVYRALRKLRPHLA